MRRSKFKGNMLRRGRYKGIYREFFGVPEHIPDKQVMRYVEVLRDRLLEEERIVLHENK